MMNLQTRTGKWIIALVLFVGFLLEFWLDGTGIDVHQWMAIALGLLVGYHFWVHRAWIESVTLRFFNRKAGRARLFYIVDAGLLLGFSFIGLSGLLVSNWLDLDSAIRDPLVFLHIIGSIATLGLVAAKVGIHWRWVVSATRSLQLRAPTLTSRAAASVVGSAGAAQLRRREMLALMGGLALVASLGGLSALSGLSQRVAAASAPETGPVAGGAGLSAGGSSGTSSSSSSCVIRCNRRCSYPGRCRRYTDSNRNGRCDLGECA